MHLHVCEGACVYSQRLELNSRCLISLKPEHLIRSPMQIDSCTWLHPNAWLTQVHTAAPLPWTDRSTRLHPYLGLPGADNCTPMLG